MHLRSWRCSPALVAKLLMFTEVLVSVLSERSEEQVLEPTAEEQPHAGATPESGIGSASDSRSMQVTSKIALISLVSAAALKTTEATKNEVSEEAAGADPKDNKEGKHGADNSNASPKAPAHDVDVDNLVNIHRQRAQKRLEAADIPKGTIKDIDQESLFRYLPSLKDFEDQLINHFRRDKNKGGILGTLAASDCAEFPGSVSPSFSHTFITDKYGCGWTPPGNDRANMHVKDKTKPVCSCSRLQLCEQQSVDEFLYAYQNHDVNAATEVGKLYMAGRCYYPVQKPIFLTIIIAIIFLCGGCTCLQRLMAHAVAEEPVKDERKEPCKDDPYLFGSTCEAVLQGEAEQTRKQGS